MYEKTLALVTDLFKDKVDKAGLPYINHLLGVANQGKNEYEKILGLLHDVIEDTKLNAYDLLKLGYPIDIVSRVELLTKPKNISYRDYVDNIINKGDLITLKIKKYDLNNNLDKNRQAKLSKEKIIYFNQRYLPALEKINQKILELEAKEMIEI